MSFRGSEGRLDAPEKWLLPVVVVTLFAACSAVDSTPPLPSTPRVETSDFASGSRLRAQAWDVDGALILRHFFDTERGEACAFDDDVAHLGPDRTHWCLPLGMARHDPASGPFADRDCTSPLGLAPLDGEASYVLVNTPNACATPPAVHRAGAAARGRPWVKDGASCVRASVEIATLSLGELVPLSSFVRGEEAAEERGSRIAALRIVTPDGARQSIGGWDADRWEAVRVDVSQGVLEAPREARWVPSRVAFQGAIARFSDAACTASIPTKSAADAVCPLTAIAVFTGQCSAASYHTLGAPLDPAELYEIDPRGACVRATSSSNSAGGSPTTFSFRLGAPIPVDAFARATTIEAGTGLVRRRGWGGPGGAASVWSDVVDVRVGACAVDAAVDGVRRCLPAKSVSIDLWADESCGTPAFIAPSDTCSPPLPRFVRATSAGDEGARVYEVLGATKTLFEGTSETCRPTTLPASVTGYALAEVDVSGFVPVSEVER